MRLFSGWLIRVLILGLATIAFWITSASKGGAQLVVNLPQPSALAQLLNSPQPGSSPQPAGSTSTSALSSETAPVVVDGRSIFRVGSVPNFSAAERADFINRVLAQELVYENAPEVMLDEQNRQTILRVNDRYLLTITDRDIRSGISVEEQARQWQQSLQQSLQQAQLERSPGHVGKMLIKSVWVLLAVVILQQGLAMLRRWLSRQRRQGSEAGGAVRQSAHQTLLHVGVLLGQIGLWLWTIVHLSDRFPLLRQGRYQILQLASTSLTVPILGIGNQSYSLLDLLGFVILTIALWWGIRTLTRLLRTQVLQVTGVDPSVQDTVSALVQYGLIFLGVVIILQSRGVDLSALTLLASVFGIGISLGLQNTANNFISGLIIAFEKPIKRGDLVKLDDLIGTVDAIGPRSTRIYTLDQVSIIVPNSRFLDESVINWSHGDPVSRLQVPVGVAYGSNIAQVQQAILEAAHGHPDILRHPVPQVWFQEFGDSSLNFLLLVWVCDPQKQFKIRSELNYRLEAALRRYEIEIPFPQRDLHVRSPQLEQMVKHWTAQNAPPPSNLVYPASVKPRPDPEPTVSPDSPAASSILPELDLSSLAAQMRGPDGVEIRDRRYGFKTYTRSFVGSEATAWLMRTQRATRDSAVQLGQRLLDQGWFHHVTDDHSFKDEYLFYRFYADEKQAESQPAEVVDNEVASS